MWLDGHTGTQFCIHFVKFIQTISKITDIHFPYYGPVNLFSYPSISIPMFVTYNNWKCTWSASWALLNKVYMSQKPYTCSSGHRMIIGQCLPSPIHFTQSVECEQVWFMSLGYYITDLQKLVNGQWEQLRKLIIITVGKNICSIKIYCRVYLQWCVF